MCDKTKFTTEPRGLLQIVRFADSRHFFVTESEICPRGAWTGGGFTESRLRREIRCRDYSIDDLDLLSQTDWSREKLRKNGEFPQDNRNIFSEFPHEYSEYLFSGNYPRWSNLLGDVQILAARLRTDCARGCEGARYAFHVRAGNQPAAVQPIRQALFRDLAALVIAASRKRLR